MRRHGRTRSGRLRRQVPRDERFRGSARRSGRCALTAGCGGSRTCAFADTGWMCVAGRVRRLTHVRTGRPRRAACLIGAGLPTSARSRTPTRREFGAGGDYQTKWRKPPWTDGLTSSATCDRTARRSGRSSRRAARRSTGARLASRTSPWTSLRTGRRRTRVLDDTGMLRKGCGDACASFHKRTQGASLVRTGPATERPGRAQTRMAVPIPEGKMSSGSTRRLAMPCSAV